MLDQHAVEEKMARLLEARRPGYNLPQPFYTDRDVFDYDVREIFGRSWLLIGFEIEFPKPGSYMALTVGRSPIVILRGQDGVLRGFFNSCRHRGAQILADGCGTARRMVCPYHQWGYNDHGALVGARMPAEFDKSTHGLKPIHVRTVAGTVYICLAEDAPDFSEFAEKMAPLLAPHDLLNAKVAHQYTLMEKGNWKLVMENARECYHFEASNTVDLAGFEARMTALGLPCGPVEGSWWQAVRFPLRAGFKSMTVDGSACVNKLMCDVNGGDVGSLRWALEPHSFAHALGDITFMFQCLPVGPEETIVYAKWLVHKDAVEGVDYQLDHLLQVWNETNLQDRDLVENNQRGVNSLGFVPGPFSTQSESLALRFTDWYVNRVRELLPRPEGNVVSFRQAGG